MADTELESRVLTRIISRFRDELNDEDDILKQPGTMTNIFLADAIVATRKMTEYELWDWAAWSGADGARQN